MQPLPGDFTLALHADGQWGSQPLIPAEGYFAGGFDTVRGYRQYEAIGDNAVRGRAELTTPELFAIPIDRIWQRRRSADYTIRVKVAAFYDAAQLWVQDAQPGQTSQFRLEGVGGGIRVKFPKDVGQLIIDQGFALQRHRDHETGRHVCAFLRRPRILMNRDSNNMRCKRVIAGLMMFAYLAQPGIMPIVLANPTGPAVVGGDATVSGLGTSHVTIAQASQQAIINWQQFNIAPNEVTQFIQPNVQAIALNRIFDQNPSQIFGSLRANGTVILLNPNGIMFGPNAQVNVGGLIASSLNLSNANFLAGHYLFQGTGLEGWVKNAGTIQGQYGGVYLLAPNVENSGVITSPGGNIVLAAGAKAFLSNRPDGRGFLAELSNPLGQAVNLKDLIADGGNITLAGRVVNQAGLIQANSVRERNGKIEIYASETLTLKSGSQTIAKGGSDGLSNGGTILAIADKIRGTAKFEKGATMDVSGGSAGGHAGFVELSGSRVGLGGRFIGTANPGFRSGRLLIDPTMDLDLTGFTATDFANISFATPRDALGNLLPDYDLRVTGFFDLNSVQPPPTGGTIRFDAGRDLIFRDLTLWNNPFGQPTKWDIVGVAERNILFTGFTGTTLQTAYGGGIDLWAKTGNVNLIDPQTGALVHYPDARRRRHLDQNRAGLDREHRV